MGNIQCKLRKGRNTWETAIKLNLVSVRPVKISTVCWQV